MTRKKHTHILNSRAENQGRQKTGAYLLPHKISKKKVYVPTQLSSLPNCKEYYNFHIRMRFRRD